MIWWGMKIFLYFGEGEKQNWTCFFFLGGGGGHFYAILGPVLSSMYKIQNGDSLRVAKISCLFVYLCLN